VTLTEDPSPPLTGSLCYPGEGAAKGAASDCVASPDRGTGPPTMSLHEDLVPPEILAAQLGRQGFDARTDATYMCVHIYIIYTHICVYTYAYI